MKSTIESVLLPCCLVGGILIGALLGMIYNFPIYIGITFGIIVIGWGSFSIFWLLGLTY